MPEKKPGVTAAELGIVAPCPNHEEREATERCKTCMRPVCTQCIIDCAYGRFCSPKCVMRELEFRSRPREPEAERPTTGPRSALLPLLAVGALVVGGIWAWQHQQLLLALYHQYIH